MNYRNYFIIGTINILLAIALLYFLGVVFAINILIVFAIISNFTNLKGQQKVIQHLGVTASTLIGIFFPMLYFYMCIDYLKK